MMLRKSMSLKTVMLAAITAWAVVGCAGMGAPVTPEAQVKQRAAERWEAMRAKNFRSAYAYLSPGFRALHTQDEYAQSMGDGNAWLATDVIGVTCEQQVCRATVRIDVATPMPRKFGDKITTHVYEDWVLVGSEWWFNQK